LVPELLRDLEALGSWPDEIVELPRPLGLPRGTTRVLEPGGGKGTVSLRLAAELGFLAYGVDRVEAFLVEARQRADALGLAGPCTFEHRNLRAQLPRARGYDVVVHAAVGGLLGSPEEMMGVLRRHPGRADLIAGPVAPARGVPDARGGDGRRGLAAPEEGPGARRPVTGFKPVPSSAPDEGRPRRRVEWRE
jgi:hypothetical protein